ncbi:MAG TPA: TaqI-like C-terminal specificity domain-containing protein [Clostridiales bacterium]|nr:TaqI-like C-terminal specificity domain-containing protein [Clostridiales bacterium]
MNYITVTEAAEKFNLSKRRVQLLCEQNRLDGAKLFSGVWLIPENAKKPGDARVKGKKSENRQPLFTLDDEQSLSLAEVCDMLSISQATAKNWLRLGKLKAKDGKGPTFEKSDILSLSQSIQNSDNHVLKSRRNKKSIRGSALYKDYIDHQGNRAMVEEILTEEIALNEKYLRVVLTNFALQLFFQSTSRHYEKPNLIVPYLRGELSLGTYGQLFADLLDLKEKKTTKQAVAKMAPFLHKEAHFVKGEDTLGFIYLSLKDMEQRKSTGAYYTPLKTVRKLLDRLTDATDLKDKTVFDPCCGSGNFLISLAAYDISPAQLYGQDIDAISVQLARLNVALTYQTDDLAVLYGNFVCGDTLRKTFPQCFDAVIGNPPWGYCFAQKDLPYLIKTYATASEKGTESYNLFIERSLAKLSPKGCLALVLPEAVLNVTAHEAVREIILSACSFQFVSYLGNAFAGVQCPAILLGLCLADAGSTKGCKVDTEHDRFTIKENRVISKDCFSFSLSDAEQACIDKIQSLKNPAYLRGQAKFALGIVTGDNKTHMKKERTEGDEIVLKGSDIFKYKIRPSGHYIHFTPEQFQQVAPVEMYRAKEKLLYRFIGETLIFAYDDQQTLSLNSCNILIPEIPGLKIKYILAILNTRIASFYCLKRFHSVKHLRSHIEAIPIPVIPVMEEEKQQEIINKVDLLLKGQGDIKALYDDLDEKIMDLYHLTKSERQTIRQALDSKNNFLFSHSDSL